MQNNLKKLEKCLPNHSIKTLSDNSCVGFVENIGLFSRANNDGPSHQFLISSKYIRGDIEFNKSVTNYFAESSQIMLSLNERLDTSTCLSTKLVGNHNLEMPLTSAIKMRRSIRKFTGNTLKFEDLSTLLFSARGVTGHLITEEFADPIKIPIHSAPSAGGTNPIDIYFISLKSENLKDGIYQYVSIENQLIKHDLNIEEKSFKFKLEEIFSLVENNIAVSDLSGIFIFVARPWKTMRKYGHRGLRFIFLEAGAIAQNIHLTSTAIGIGSVDWGGFYDDELNELLFLDGINNLAIHAILIGTK